MKNTVTSLLLVSFLFLSTFATSGVSSANPYLFPWINREVASPVQTFIQFDSPSANGTVLNQTKLAVSYSAVIVPAGFNVYITKIYYCSSWDSLNRTVYPLNAVDPQVTNHSSSIYLNKIPQGNQTLTVTVAGYGEFGGGWEQYYFNILCSAQLTFTVDSIAPEVTLQPLNSTYLSSQVPVVFVTNESISKAVYSLDGNQNMTVNQNFTLCALAAGNHNLTLYAWDTAGNVGKTETAPFAVAAPTEAHTGFPAEILAAAVVVACAAAGLGVYMFFRHRTSSAQTPPHAQ